MKKPHNIAFTVLIVITVGILFGLMEANIAYQDRQKVNLKSASAGIPTWTNHGNIIDAGPYPDTLFVDTETYHINRNRLIDTLIARGYPLNKIVILDPLNPRPMDSGSEINMLDIPGYWSYQFDINIKKQ